MKLRLITIIACACIVLGSGTLSAQAIPVSTGTHPETLDQFMYTREYLPAVYKAAAEGAALSAINTVPMPMQPPENFAFGFSLGASGLAPLNQGSPLAWNSPNAIVGGTPVRIDPAGGSAGTSLYAIAPGSFLGLRSDYVLAFHASYHTVALKDDAAGSLEDLAAPAKASRTNVRSRGIGFRLGLPLMDPKGWEHLAWNGVQLSLGASFLATNSRVRTEMDADQYIRTDLLLDPANAAALSSSLVATTFAFRQLETQSETSSKSTNFVIPIELKTGARLGFLNLTLGPGVALNYGKTKVASSTTVGACSGIAGPCSERYYLQGIIAFLEAQAAGSTGSTASIFPAAGSDPAVLQVVGSRSLSARALIPYFMAEVRMEIYYLDLIVRGVSSGGYYSASAAIQVRY